MSTGTLAKLATELLSGRICVIDLTQTLAPEFPPIVLAPEFGQCLPFRRNVETQALEVNGRLLVHPLAVN